MDAPKAWVGKLYADLLAMAARRPFRTLLRRISVLTMLGFAGVVLSVAALMVIIGIGETQIVASESRGGHHAHLLANGWFVVGLVAVPDRA